MVLDWFALLWPWDRLISDWLEFGCRWFVDFAVGDKQEFHWSIFVKLRFFRTGPTMVESMTIVLKTGYTMGFIFELQYVSTIVFFFMAFVLLAVQTTATKTEKTEKNMAVCFFLCSIVVFFSHEDHRVNCRDIEIGL